MQDDRWPALPYDQWKDTCATLHMWAQMIGKIALAQAPAVNRSWAVALHPTSRGLQTAALPHGSRMFTLGFDFVDHRLEICASDGSRRTLPLAARPVAEFYRELMAALEAMNLPVRIWPMPVEIPAPIRFEQDTVHCSYDPEFANGFWRIVVQVHRVFNTCRASFLGKCSPVHFFWGSFDLAVTRLSGKPIPPRDGPAFMRDAYSHEVISHGFWPGACRCSSPHSTRTPSPSRRASKRCASPRMQRSTTPS